MTRLSVNLNKIALLRNSRGRDYPSVVGFARRAIACGVHGITVHPRPDQRHIRFQDVADLGAVLAAHPDVEFNIEGNPTDEFLDLVLAARPQQCTLVPDDPGQLTSDHGWDVVREGDAVRPVVARLREAGIRVSLFLDPVVEQVDAAGGVGTDRIELYTEGYAVAFGTVDQAAVLATYRRAAERARGIGLGVNAGHDLNLDNLALFLSIEGIEEVSIGHAIVVEAFDHGYDQTLARYLDIVG